MQPTTLSPEQVKAIQQQFDYASAMSYPPEFTDTTKKLTFTSPTAIFLFTIESSGATIFSGSSISDAEREKRADVLAQTYAPLMLLRLCWQGKDHFETFAQWEKDGLLWYPPRYLNGKQQANLGAPGQYALPNAYQPQGKCIGPYPATKPDGWIDVPPVSQLLVEGADVEGLLEEWFPHIAV